MSKDDTLFRTQGSALVLMGMSDAVALIDLRLGAQVQPRRWVAQDAVVEARSEKQSLLLSLKNGAEVPVGRTFSVATKARFGRHLHTSC